MRALTNQIDHGKFQLITLQGGVQAGHGAWWGTKGNIKGVQEGKTGVQKWAQSDWLLWRASTNQIGYKQFQPITLQGGRRSWREHGVRTGNFMFWTFFFALYGLSKVGRSIIS